MRMRWWWRWAHWPCARKCFTMTLAFHNVQASFSSWNILHHIHPSPKGCHVWDLPLRTYETWTPRVASEDKFVKLPSWWKDFQFYSDTRWFASTHDVLSKSCMFIVFKFNFWLCDLSMIIICCVAENAMFDIFETWAPSNPELSNVLNWSLSTNPCTDWGGVSCSQWNESINQDTLTDNVSTLRYVTSLFPYAYFIT